MIVVGYDDAGDRVSFDNFTDKVYEVEFGIERKSPPAGYDPLRPARLVSAPCDHIEVYLYVVANTFPDSVAIKDSPPFKVRLKVTPEGSKVAEERSYDVNQWGGLTIPAERFPAEK